MMRTSRLRLCSSSPGLFSLPGWPVVLEAFYHSMRIWKMAEKAVDPHHRFHSQHCSSFCHVSVVRLGNTPSWFWVIFVLVYFTTVKNHDYLSCQATGSYFNLRKNKQGTNRHTKTIVWGVFFKRNTIIYHNNSKKRLNDVSAELTSVCSHFSAVPWLAVH